MFYGIFPDNRNLKFVGMKTDYNMDLRAWNTFGMKVSCACFVEYGTVEELEGLWKMRHGMSPDGLPSPFLHIGRGSNLLFTKDFPGTVFHSDIRFISVLDGTGHQYQPGDSAAETCADLASDGKVSVEAGAGVLWDDFCLWCAERGLWGPENLSGIPGEVGAAAVQNIGAYGVEAKDIISQVKCFDCVTGRRVAFKASECGYGYRDSMFKDSAKGRYVVTSVVFTLSSAPVLRLDYGHVKEAVNAAFETVSGPDVPDVAAPGTDVGKSGQDSAVGHGKGVSAGEGSLSPMLVRNVILSIRNAKLPDPAVIGSAGSFFKNPVIPRSDYERIASVARIEHGADYEVPHYDAGSGFIKVPAAWLLDQCGLKGLVAGNAGIYEKQPLVIVNLTGNASPSEILAVEAMAVKAVYEKFGVTLHPEVEHV